MNGTSSAAARVIATCRGRVERRGAAADGVIESAIWKLPVTGPLHVGESGFDGDEQADRRVHGGPEKAVLVYCATHYPEWSAELQLPNLGAGAFGENLTVVGLDEGTAAIGDVLAIGTARLQVAQTRAPCWKLARKLERPEVVELVIRHGRPGWYLRVLQPGAIAAGDAITVVERPFPQLTIARQLQVLYRQPLDLELAREFANCPALSPSARARIAAKLG